MKRQLLLWASVPLCSALYQLCTKMAATQLQATGFGMAWLHQAAHTPWLLGALLCEIVAFVAWMRILSTQNLSRAFPLTGVGYVLILMMGWFGFHEAVYPLQILGSTLILAGVWMIGTATQTHEVSQ